MRDQLLEFFAAREERVHLGGMTLFVRTLPDEQAGISGEDALYQAVVRCTFGEDGSLIFTEADIPELRAQPRIRKAALLAAVSRVNGFDLAAEEKNSEADPSSG